jgi:hypothetical protein
VLTRIALAATTTALLTGCGGAASTTSSPTSSGSQNQALLGSANSGPSSATAAPRSGILAVSLAISGPQKAVTPGGPAVDLTWS